MVSIESNFEQARSKVKRSAQTEKRKPDTVGKECGQRAGGWGEDVVCDTAKRRLLLYCSAGCGSEVDGAIVSIATTTTNDISTL